MRVTATLGCEDARIGATRGAKCAGSTFFRQADAVLLAQFTRPLKNSTSATYRPLRKLSPFSLADKGVPISLGQEWGNIYILHVIFAHYPHSVARGDGRGVARLRGASGASGAPWQGVNSPTRASRVGLGRAGPPVAHVPNELRPIAATDRKARHTRPRPAPPRPETRMQPR